MTVRLLTSFTVFIAASVLASLCLLVPGRHGLDETRAILALGAGVLMVIGYLAHAARSGPGPADGAPHPSRRRFSPWTAVMFAAFALFGVRSFCWLAVQDGNSLRIASPNNLGDLSLHMLLSNYFANGAAWWPDHPQDAWASMRYYPGIDLFQSLLNIAGADELCALTWVGLIGTAVLALALREWGGGFAMAGFLFSGGLAGFRIFKSLVVDDPLFQDYQTALAWKSLPLAMFVTQRPFLFALPAGLLLLAHWRAKYFTRPTPLLLGRQMDVREEAPARGLIPFWVELLLYAAMPVLHLFTFMFLSGLLGWWTVLYWKRLAMRRRLLVLIGLALAPASLQIYLMTGFIGGNIHFKPEWMRGADESFLGFWLVNFGLFLPLGIACWLQCVWPPIRAILEEDETGWTAAPPHPADDGSALAARAFVIPSGIIFVVVSVVMLTVWEWDNTKVMLWCYLATLPFIWERWIAPLRSAARWPVCAALFFSGFVCLIGGLKADSGTGYELARRDELDPVRSTVRNLPIEARFAAVPSYNHPLVFCGRKLAMGYVGHLHSQGLPYAELETSLRTLMLGRPEWGECAGRLGVRYLYWGSREEEEYPGSAKPWETRCQRVASGSWGSIYDLQQSPEPP